MHAHRSTPSQIKTQDIIALRNANKNRPDDKRAPRVLVLVGIPGSGKSTFSSLLESIGLVIISQDQLGTRFKCERKIVRALLEGKDVVVDRCNFDTTQRKHWLDYGNAAGATIGVVVFGTPIETCIKRVDSRKGHRTLRPGPQSATVIRRMATDFVFPTRKEGFVFCRVIRTDQDGQRVSNEVFEWFSSP